MVQGSASHRGSSTAGGSCSAAIRERGREGRKKRSQRKEKKKKKKTQSPLLFTQSSTGEAKNTEEKKKKATFFLRRTTQTRVARRLQTTSKLPLSKSPPGGGRSPRGERLPPGPGSGGRDGRTEGQTAVRPRGAAEEVTSGGAEAAGAARPGKRGPRPAPARRPAPGKGGPGLGVRRGHPAAQQAGGEKREREGGGPHLRRIFPPFWWEPSGSWRWRRGRGGVGREARRRRRRPDRTGMREPPFLRRHFPIAGREKFLPTAESCGAGGASGLAPDWAAPAAGGRRAMAGRTARLRGPGRSPGCWGGGGHDRSPNNPPPRPAEKTLPGAVRFPHKRRAGWRWCLTGSHPNCVINSRLHLALLCGRSFLFFPCAGPARC